MIRRSVDGKSAQKSLAVSSINGMYVGKDGSTYYQVQWSPSWERGDSISGCDKLIQEFHIRQENEIFGGPLTNTKQTAEQMKEIKTSITEEMNEVRNTINTKLSGMEVLLGEQQKCNDEFSRRLGTLEEVSGFSTNYYYDRIRRQPTNATETDGGGSVLQGEDLTNRDKEDENNELYFEDIMYSDYMEDSMEPRRKRNRGDIAVGVPVNVDNNLMNKIKERLEAANSVSKEAEVIHAVRVCNIRHILALKLAQIIFSNEELAGASYAPGNFNPLDDGKLSLIEDLSFMRFRADESEVKEVSWGQIHQRIKNKCRCKRKEYNDKLTGTASNFKISTLYPPNPLAKDKTNMAANYKSTMAYSMAARNKFSSPYNYQVSTKDSPSDRFNSNSPRVFDLTNEDAIIPTTNINSENVQSSSSEVDLIQTSSNNIETNPSDITIIFKEDESDYTDES